MTKRSQGWGIVPSTLVVMALTATSAHATDLVTDPTPSSMEVPPPPPPIAPPTSTASPTPPPPAGSTAATLARATDEDSGVGLHFIYVRPELGAGHFTLGRSATSIDTTPTGPIFGLSAGVELLFVQVGASLRELSGSDFNLWTLGAEVAYAPLHGRFLPRIGVNAGSVWTGSFNSALCPVQYASLSNCGFHPSGFDVGVSGGASYFVTGNIELGADIGLDLLKFSGYSTKLTTGSAASQITSTFESPSSTGSLLSLLFHVAWHGP